MRLPSRSALRSGPLLTLAFLMLVILLRNILPRDTTAIIGTVILAWFLTDTISKCLANNAPFRSVNPSNKAVFITGCDSGFGWELARRLDTMGFTVFAGCLMADKDGAQKLKECCSERLRTIQVDVTKDEDVNRAVKEVGANLGEQELFAVVSNAGVAIFTEVEWCPLDVYRRIFEVNAMGPIRVTKAFLPLLRESRGRVIIVASLAGRYTFPGFTAYSMSKHAAVSFADGLRREMKKWGISVHTVEPTLYKTPISAEKVLRSNLENTWEATPTDIKETYGKEYFYAFQESMTKMSLSAKKNIEEVVQDLVDSVASRNPKTRYVPSAAVQMRARLLASFPTAVQDMIMCRTQPRCIPAARKVAAGVAVEATLKMSGDPVNLLRRRFKRSQTEPPGAKFSTFGAL